ncbi:hypothetical protein F4703DRAFT_1831763, partial [Phycomyces blakesleeanus]
MRNRRSSKKKSIVYKYYKCKLKSTVVTKCHKSGYIGFLGRLSDENVLRIMFSIIPIVVFDAHVSIIQLKSKGVYIVEEVCSFRYPKSFHEIKDRKL